MNIARRRTRAERNFQRVISTIMIAGLVAMGSPLPVMVNSARAAPVTVVNGRVTTPDGAGVANHTVEFHLADGTYFKSIFTNASGDYSVDVEGSELTIGKTYVLEVRSLQGYNKPLESSVNREWTGTKWTNVNFQFISASKTVTGSVTYEETGQPVSSAEISAFPVNSAIGPGVTTMVNQQGEYTLDLRKGTNWYVNVQNNIGNRQDDWMVTSKPVFVEFSNDDSQETQEKDFAVAKATGRVHVKLLNSDGRGLTTSDFVGDVWWAGPAGISTVRKLDFNSEETINLVPGIYSFFVYHRDLEGKSFPSESLNVVIKDGETLDLGTIQAEVNAGKIKGTLKDSSGKAISNQPIIAQHIQLPSRTETQSTSSGSFEFTVGPGTYRLNVGQGGPGDVWRMTAPVEVTVDANGAVVDGVEVTGEEWGNKIEGVLRDASAAILDSVNGAVSAEINGEFFSAPVVDGAYQMDVPKDAIGKKMNLSFQAEPDGGSDGYALSQAKETNVQQHANVDLTLIKDNGVISGTAKDPEGNTLKPGAGEIEVIATDAIGNMETGFVDEAGKFQLNVPAGEWNVSYQVKSDHPDFFNLAASHEAVTVGANKTATMTMEVLEREGTVKGSVNDDDGKGVALAPVRISNLPNLQASGQAFTAEDVVSTVVYADNEGNYSVKLPDGNYTVEVGSTPDVAASVEPESQTITVVKNKTEDVDLEYRAADATINGTVTDAAGKAVTSGKVAAFTADGGYVDTQIQDDGSYRLPVNAGEEWTVVASAFEGSNLLMQENLTVTPSKGSTTQALKVADTGIDVPGGVSMSFEGDKSAGLSLPDGTHIALPPFAVDETGGDVEIQVSPTVDLSPTASGEPVSVSYTFEAIDSSGYQVKTLNRPAKITVEYPQEVIDQKGIDERQIVPEFYNENEDLWGNDGVTSFVDPEANKAVLVTEHLTKFSLNSGAGSPLYSPGIIRTEIKSDQSRVHVYDSEGEEILAFKAFAGDENIVVETGDIDGDGSTDVLVTKQDSSALSTFRQFDSDGKMKVEKTPFGSLKGGSLVKLADLNGDGDDEVLVAPRFLGSGLSSFYEVQMWDWNAQKKTLKKTSSMSVKDWMPRDLVLLAGDVDGDGAEEGIVRQYGEEPEVKVMTLNAKGKLTAHSEFQMRSGESTAIGDVNGNGTMDVVGVAYTYRSLEVWEYNPTKKKWKVLTKTSIPNRTYAVIAGDLNGDNQAEMTIHDWASGKTRFSTYIYKSKSKKLSRSDEDVVTMGTESDLKWYSLEGFETPVFSIAPFWDGYPAYLYTLNSKGKHQRVDYPALKE